MKGRTLALGLLVYLSLDLANPFMPGAVTFVDGGLHVIDAGRPAGIDRPVLDGPGLGAAGLPPGALAAARPALAPPAAPAPRRRWWTPARRVRSPAPEPAPASDDH